MAPRKRNCNQYLACEQASSEGEKKIRPAKRVGRGKAPLCTLSSPDRSQLLLLALDYTRLTRPKPQRQPGCRLVSILRRVNVRSLHEDQFLVFTKSVDSNFRTF